MNIYIGACPNRHAGEEGNMRTKGKLRKLLSTAMALVFLLALLPVGARAAEDSDWVIKVLDDGSAEITAYHGNESELIIPGIIDDRMVTRIGGAVFQNNETLLRGRQGLPDRQRKQRQRLCPDQSRRHLRRSQPGQRIQTHDCALRILRLYYAAEQSWIY